MGTEETKLSELVLFQHFFHQALKPAWRNVENRVLPGIWSFVWWKFFRLGRRSRIFRQRFLGFGHIQTAQIDGDAKSVSRVAWV